MSTLNTDLTTIQTIEDGLVENQVARFAYTETAYETDDVDGVDTYDADAEQNIPNGTASIMKVNDSVIEKGFRSQASSLTRMLVNHFFGRVSYNLNKLNDNFSSLVTTLTSHLGAANGFASLDADGRIPYSQLPESAIEFKGTWNASTNVWTSTDSTTGSLVDGTGTIGDMYVVTTAGWFDSSTGTSSSTEVSGYTEYLVNDRILYNGSTWMKLSSGSVKAVNGVYPESGEVTLYGSDIEMNSSDSSKLDDMINSKQPNVIELTQDEYDELSDSDKEGNLYVITDADTNDNSLIDDSVRSTDSTWSSDRIAPSIQVFTAGTTTITGGTLYTGAVIRVMFTSAITGSDTSTALSLTYNDTAYSVMVGKQGSLSNFVASYVDSAYTYLQAYTTLELAFDGTQFIIIGNPVVLSSSDYTIYADGQTIGIDSTPTSGSTNFVTSGGIYSSISGVGGKRLVIASPNGSTMYYKLSSNYTRVSDVLISNRYCDCYFIYKNTANYSNIVHLFDTALGYGVQGVRIGTDTDSLGCILLKVTGYNPFAIWCFSPATLTLESITEDEYTSDELTYETSYDSASSIPYVAVTTPS